MGLQDLDGMDVPDNKGGRPPEEDKEEQWSGSTPGDPYIPYKDDEEWWRDKFETAKQKTDDIDAAVTEVSRIIHVNPIEIRKRLSEYDIYDTDWDEYRDKYDVHEEDLRIPGVEVTSVGIRRIEKMFSSTSSSSSSSSSSNNEPSSGLSSMLDG